MMKTLKLLRRRKQIIGTGVLSLLFMLSFIKASAQANFTLFPATTAVPINQTFTLEVRVDLNQATNTELDVAEAYLNFDPAYLQVQSITNGSTLSLVVLSSFNNTAGTIDYSASTLTPPVTADFTLLTITFRAIATPPNGTTNVTFNTSLPRKTDAFRTGNSILGTTNGATIAISAGAGLPVIFTDFSASLQGNNVILKWTTATEINNKGFEIERSTDATSWTTLGFVNGANNTNEEEKYSYTDNILNPGLYYYRLKQEDRDGKFKYTHVIPIKFENKKVFELGQNQPNPFSGRTSVSFSLAEKRKVTLTIYDVYGRLIKTVLNETKDAGTHVIDLNLQALSSGVYYYKIVAGDFTSVKNMVVK